MPKPEKIAPATKYGGKMVVCHPGRMDVAKSKLTMEWTESTRGVERPAKTSETASKRCHSLAVPRQPKDKMLYTIRAKLPGLARSRTVAKSGISPVYQKRREMVKYVLMAKTSHRSGELKLTQREPWY
jgi:hypothetical protein